MDGFYGQAGYGLQQRDEYDRCSGQFVTRTVGGVPITQWPQTGTSYIAHGFDGYSLPFYQRQKNYWSSMVDRSSELSKALMSQVDVNSRYLEHSGAILSTLQDLCNFEANPGKSRPSCKILGKDRMHPFYRRQSLKPAEGMTRTRDKYRVVYTEKQRKGLEKEYDTNKFLTSQRRSELSKELSLSERQIKIWFQNRRAKERRDKRKASDDRESSTKKTMAIDDNEDVDQAVNTSDNTTVPSSCRYAGIQPQPEITESITTDTDRSQCRFQQTSYECNIVTNIVDNIIVTTANQDTFPRQTVSPSEWGNTESNLLIPALNVSPLAVNMDFDFGPRL